MTTQSSKIIWTRIDEAPALATYSFLPIVQAFTKGTGVEVETSDISLAGRIIASFPERLTEAQRIPDNLTQLGELTLKPEANIIKLPNVSASLPQLNAAIKELQGKGYNLPDYPENPQTDEEKEIQARYSKVLGSAVNPVLREGNSDRRAPLSVKNFARKNPHKLGPWTADSKAEVAFMSSGDFYGNEKSVVMGGAGELKIELVAKDGAVKVLKDKLKVSAGEIVDGTFMSKNALRAFYAEHRFSIPGLRAELLNRIALGDKGVIDETRFDELTGYRTLPFARPPAMAAGRPWRVAVKMIDPRGNEGLRVITMPTEA